MRFDVHPTAMKQKDDKEIVILEDALYDTAR